MILEQVSVNYELNHILGVYEKHINKTNVSFLREILNDYMSERKLKKIRDKIDFYIYMQMHSKWQNID